MTIYRGFSLIEILVAVAIIATLTAVSAAGFAKQQKAARDTKRIADASNIGSAVATYKTIYNTYPGDPSVANGDGVDISSQLNTLVDNGYLNALPRDPKPASPVVYAFCTNYAYALSSTTYGQTPPTGDSLYQSVTPTIGRRAFVIFFATEVAGNSSFRHPQSPDTYATQGLTWCGGTRGYAYLLGPKSS